MLTDHGLLRDDEPSCQSTDGVGEPSSASGPSTVWEAVRSGRWTVSERFEANGLYHLVLARTSRQTRLLHLLSNSEEAAVRGSALGHANKYLCHELLLSPSAVSSTIRRARRKLGVRSQLELVQLVQESSFAGRHGGVERVTLSFPASADNLLTALTSSERDVCRSILNDLSNREIARLRGRSARTIANQVASIFRKLRAQSRAELIAVCSSRAALAVQAKKVP